MTDPNTPISTPVPPVAPSVPAAAPLGKALPVAGAIFAGVAFLTAVVPGPSFSTWFFAIGAIIIAIIALARKSPLRGLSTAAVIVAPLAWLIAIIVSVVSLASGAHSTAAPQQPLQGQSSPSQAAQPSPAAQSISGGDHVVGTDFSAGQYRAEVKKGIIQLCTVVQNIDGSISDIRNSAEGSVIFTVQDTPGSVVSFSGCDHITLAGDAVRPNPNPITNGDWLVGPEIPAGQYKGTVDATQLVQLGTIAQYNGKDVVDINNGNEGDVIFTVQDIPGSVVSFSGLTNISKIG